MGDGRQPLNIRAEHPLEGARLGLAQLRELGGDVRNWAVVLAQLHAGAGVLGTGSVSLPGQRHGQGFDPAFATPRTRPDGHRRRNRGLERAIQHGAATYTARHAVIWAARRTPTSGQPSNTSY